MPAVTPRRIAVLFGLGAFLVQSAWILAVPPYRGIDEFDHVYRANSVAEGHWRTWAQPENGRGDLIPVRRSVIEDGQEVCRSFKYTGPDNCRAVEDAGGGLATVASAASRYHPAFYWVIGWPSLAFDGSAAVYAMRWVAALICATLIAVIACLVSSWGSTPWPTAGLGLGLTPVLVYSTSLPAPNGIEMVAGLGLWACILTIAAVKGGPRSLIGLATAFAVILVTVRPLGTLWAALILLTCVVAVSMRALVIPLRRHLRLLVIGAVTVVASVAAAGAWYVSARTYEIDVVDASSVNRWAVSASQIPAWLAQVIAAFPARNEPAPIVVYALVFIPFSALVSAALIVGNLRSRLALTLSGLSAVAASFMFTVITVARHGTIWQGRYTLPLVAGLTLLSGYTLASSSRDFRLGRPIGRLLGLGVALAHVVSIVNVQLIESRTSPLSGDARWLQVPLPLVGALATLGVSLWYFAIFSPRSPEADPNSASSPRSFEKAIV